MTFHTMRIQQSRIAVPHAVLALLILTSAAFSSCSDDIIDSGHGTEAVTFSQPADVESWGGYISFTAEPTEAAAGAEISISTAASWLSLTSDCLPADGIVEFYADANADVAAREAVIELRADGSGAPSSRIRIRQKGLADYDSNAAQSPYQDFRVGWGYNAFCEYQSSRSICNPVIDVEALQALDSDATFQSVQEGPSVSEEFDVKYAHSLQEISMQLTETMERSIKFLGMRKTTKRFTQVSTTDTHNQYYSYARLTKRVLQRSIDEGVIEYLVPKGRLPFTDKFKGYHTLISNSTSTADRQKAIRSMISEFGTHIITEAALGGAIDYVATYDRTTTQSVKVTSETHSSKIFGRSKSSTSTSTEESLTSHIDKDYSFTISGGDPVAVAALKNCIAGLSDDGMLDPDLLAQWETGISYDSQAARSNLDLIDFKLYPIWELFTDSEIKAEIQRIVLDMNQQSNNAFTDRELGIDNYYIPLEKHKVFSSAATPDAPRVLIVYDADGKPIMQMCREYVPKIRGDRPVTVFYPIFGGQVRLGQGLFIGDGEGNPPSYLFFSGSDLYVLPVEGFSSTDVVKTLYLLGGNVYASDFNTPCRELTGIRSAEERFRMQFDYDGKKHLMDAPVVKIGSGYWCSRSVNNEIGYMLFEGLRGENGIFYMACNPVVASGPIPSILITRPETSEFYSTIAHESAYGPDEDSYGNRTKWFLPRKSDYEELIRYTGNNTKALFKGQPSGFDAIFDGCFIGDPYIDYPGDAPDEANRVWFAGRKSYLLTCDNLNNFNVFVLNEDYRWTINPDPVADPEENREEWDAMVYWLDHLYPVRLFHDQGYKYPYY